MKLRIVSGGRWYEDPWRVFMSREDAEHIADAYRTYHHPNAPAFKYALRTDDTFINRLWTMITGNPL